MIILLLFSFFAGIVTILSPCILPVLPIILSSSVTEGKKRPLGIVTGFVTSFTFFTLFLSTIVRATGVSADLLRYIAIVVIAGFGLSLLNSTIQMWIEMMFSRLSAVSPTQKKEGFWGGILLGLSLGLIWAPCVGPILAAIISLALTGAVNSTAVFITLAYSLGTAIPMLFVLYGGRSVIQRIPNPVAIQKVFGVLMILTAMAMYFNIDRKFQTYILSVFPNYGTGLTKFEDNPLIKKQLDRIRNKPIVETDRGKPMYEVADLGLGIAPELLGGQEWFNSEPLTLSELKGKVVLIDFWTYTCINCIRTFPYTKAWYEKYKDQGFVLIGVHTPEFEFEKNVKNVARAIDDFGIMYPVVQDNNYTIWNAYNNRYWPAHYLIDKKGNIQYTHFGEGAYDETEKKIQELLAISSPIDNPSYEVNSRTPETYLGSARGNYSNITTTGTWTKSIEYAMPSAGGSLTYSFDAMKVFLVMRPKTQGLVGKVQVFLDDKLQKEIVVDQDKLYTLIELDTRGRHELKLTFPDDNVELYAFTFG